MTRPEGFEQTPLEMLGPVLVDIEGELTRPSGEVLPVTFRFEPEEAGAEAVYRFSELAVADCDAHGLYVSAQVEVEGGDLLNGESNASLDVLAGQIRMQIQTGDLMTSSMPPPGSDDQGIPPALVVSLQLDLECRWRGAWVWNYVVDCEGVDLCSGYDQESLSTFEAPGTCD